MTTFLGNKMMEKNSPGSCGPAPWCNFNGFKLFHLLHFPGRLVLKWSKKKNKKNKTSIQLMRRVLLSTGLKRCYVHPQQHTVFEPTSDKVHANTYSLAATVKTSACKQCLFLCSSPFYYTIAASCNLHIALSHMVILVIF